ncbi:MAG TPA: glycosyltransferase family 2 protein [Chloroflexota bacterium]|nr:glycosyltransferase family 2 protein [Chloroflexota bacterium]HUM68760.1 glycosyltransferase family 2 protein [Chloroflexota bacterium]
MEQRVIIVIPAHNEEHTITAVIQELRRIAPTFDRVIVNDCSSDATGAVITELGEKQLQLVCNLGYGQALQTGLKYALIKGYDIIVSMDADGQHQPKDVPRLVAALQESGADMVIGSRFCDGRVYDTPIDRRLGQLLFSYLTQILLRQRIYDTSSGFKAIRAAACQSLVNGSFMDFHIESIVQLKLSNFKIVETPVKVHERTHGRSMHSIASVFQYPIKTILLTLVAIMDAYLIRRAR